MNIHHRTSAAALAALCLCLFSGCGEKSLLEKVIVEGDVTYDGQPVVNGEIRFHPIENTKGPVSGAPIVDGHYRAVAKGGVPVGKQIVRIEGYRAAKSGGDGDLLSGGGGRVNYIPEKYGRRSGLNLEVLGDDSLMTHDFSLEK